MHVSARSDYAIRALATIAAHAPDLVKVDVIAGEGKLPRKFVEAIMADLRRADLVRSRRGVDGGYALARPASEITLGAAVRAVDGPLGEVRGLPASERRYEGAAESLTEVWVAVAASLSELLDQITIAQVVSGRLSRRVRGLVERSGSA